MIPGSIPNRTRYLGAPRGWEPDVSGPCGHLAIRDELTTAGPAMFSAWQPTPEEMARIAAGAPIVLMVLGEIHPPVSISVGPPPTEEG